MIHQLFDTLNIKQVEPSSFYELLRLTCVNLHVHVIVILYFTERVEIYHFLSPGLNVHEGDFVFWLSPVKVISHLHDFLIELDHANAVF